MTVEEIEEKKTRVVNNVKSTAEEIQCIVTRDLMEDIPAVSNMEDMVGELENAIAYLETYVESLGRYKDELINLVDAENDNKRSSGC